MSDTGHPTPGRPTQDGGAGSVHIGSMSGGSIATGSHGSAYSVNQTAAEPTRGTRNCSRRFEPSATPCPRGSEAPRTPPSTVNWPTPRRRSRAPAPPGRNASPAC